MGKRWKVKKLFLLSYLFFWILKASVSRSFFLVVFFRSVGVMTHFWEKQRKVWKSWADFLECVRNVSECVRKFKCVRLWIIKRNVSGKEKMDVSGYRWNFWKIELFAFFSPRCLVPRSLAEERMVCLTTSQKIKNRMQKVISTYSYLFLLICLPPRLSS